MDKAITSISIPESLRSRGVQQSKREGVSFSAYVARLIMADVGLLPLPARRRRSRAAPPPGSPEPPAPPG